jgi:hypothetical protein
MRFTKYLFIGLITACAAACDLGSEQGYSPSGDQLVIARFEEKLAKKHIAYTRDDMGFYIPSNRSQMAQMRAVGNEALDIEPSRVGVHVDSECRLELLERLLQDQDVYYYVETNGDEMIVQTTRSDAERISLTALYASTAGRCGSS